MTIIRDILHIYAQRILMKMLDGFIFGCGVILNTVVISAFFLVCLLIRATYSPIWGHFTN